MFKYRIHSALRWLARLLPSMARWLWVDTILMLATVFSLGTVIWLLFGVGGYAAPGVTLESWRMVADSATGRWAGLLAGLVPLWPTLLAGLLVMAMFYIPYRDDLTLGAFRDVVVVLMMAAFMVVLTSHGRGEGLDSRAQMDLLALSAIISTFLVISIGNFGGLGDSSGDVAIELLIMTVAAGAAESTRFHQGVGAVEVVVATFMDLAAIYVLSFCVKLLLFPGDFLTIKLSSAARGSLFALASLTILLPVAAMLLALLCAVPAGGAEMIFGQPEVTLGGSLLLPLAPLLGGTAWVTTLFVTHPVAGIAVVAGAIFSVARFAADHASDTCSPVGLRSRLPQILVLAACLVIIAVVTL